MATAGTDAQRKEVLPALIAGEAVATWALADAAGEIGAGVVATARGDGYVLSGTKGLVPEADAADWFLVTADGADGPVQALVPAGTAGVTVTALQSLDLTRRFGRVELRRRRGAGRRAGGRPRRAAPTCSSASCRSPLVLTVAESVGAMDHILAEAVEYAKARTAFGRPIGSFQAIKHLLADTSLLLETSKAVLTAPRPGPCRQRRPTRPARWPAWPRPSWATAASSWPRTASRRFGGIGFTWEHDLHLYMRRLTTDASLYGEPAWHRERICTIHRALRTRTDMRPTTQP